MGRMWTFTPDNEIPPMSLLWPKVSLVIIKSQNLSHCHFPRHFMVGPGVYSLLVLISYQYFQIIKQDENLYYTYTFY